MEKATTKKSTTDTRAARKIARTNFGALGRQILKLIFSWTVDKTHHVDISIWLFESIAGIFTKNTVS